MSAQSVLTVAGVECSKLAAQVKVRILLAVCILGPFGFAVAMRVQSSLPIDTPFGRAVQESGFAISLVVLGFAFRLNDSTVIRAVAGAPVAVPSPAR